MRAGLLTSFLAICVLTSGVASAQSAPETPAKKEEGTNSINLSPLGLLVGSYGVSYEHLFNRTHGLLLEPGVSYSKDGNSKNIGYGGVVGYRWHWSKSQNSGFLGANLGLFVGNADISVTTSAGTKTFDLSTRALTVTGNVGRRFAWDNGFNITLRIGAGYGNYKASSDSKDPDVQSAIKLANDLLKVFPIALDGEVSLGYIF